MTDQIHYWKDFSVGKLDEYISQGATALMGHYLVIFVQGTGSYYFKRPSSKLYVIDLRDNNIQEETLPAEKVQNNAGFILKKYSEHQIIMFWGSYNHFLWIKIDSFTPLKLRFEEIQDRGGPELSGFTAEIYQDCLYIFNGKDKKLWCFDLNEKAWTLCETTGEPPERRFNTGCFIREDHLYVCGGYLSEMLSKISFKQLFALNLQSMQWRKIEQQDPQPGQGMTYVDRECRVSIDTYENHMLVLKKELDNIFYKLYCCNRYTLGSWSRIDLRGQKPGRMIGNSVVYKNMLYACFTTAQKGGEFKLAALNLDKLGLVPLKSREEENFSSLFLNEEESDIKFKIQNNIIPAHKKVLMQKSKFFSGLFNSGMIESKLQVIDIDDCDFDVFNEFLRFLYCKTVDVNFSKISELYLLADKYVQEDLSDKCVTLFVPHLTPQNVSTMHDFAREHEIDYLKGWCLRIFEGYLEQNKIAWVECLKRDKEIVDFVIENLHEIVAKSEIKKNLVLYGEFLSEQISTKNIVKFTYLFYQGTPFGKPSSPIFLNEMTNLRDVLFKFVLRNFKLLERQGLSERFSSCFLSEFEKYKSKIQEEKDSTQEELQAESPTESSDQAQRKALKRLDPKSDTLGDGKNGPTLKKTKQLIGFL